MVLVFNTDFMAQGGMLDVYHYVLLPSSPGSHRPTFSFLLLYKYLSFSLLSPGSDNHQSTLCYSEFSFFSLALLRNNWNISLYRFKAHMMIWLRYIMEWFPRWLQLTSIISYQYNKKERKKKKMFPLCWKLSGFTQHISICHKAVSAQPSCCMLHP